MNQHALLQNLKMIHLTTWEPNMTSDMWQLLMQVIVVQNAVPRTGVRHLLWLTVNAGCTLMPATDNIPRELFQAV